MRLKTFWRKALLASCLAGVTSGLAQAKPIELKLGTIIPPQAPFIQKGLVPWIDAVNQDAQGTIDIQLFAGGSLVRHPDQQLSMLRNNIAQIALFPNNTSPGQFPDDAIFELPLGPENSFEASQAVWRLYDQDKLRGYEDIVVLGFLANGPNLLQTRQPVESLDDLSGLKIRTSTTAQTQMIQALGANPIGSIPITSAAESVSRGMIDGGLHNWGSWAAFRLDRVLSNHVEIPMGYSVLTLAMNAATWDKLPPEAKAAFEKHSFGKASAMFGKVDDGVAAMIRGKAIEDDNHVLPMTPEQESAWRERLQQVVAEWRQSRADGDDLYQALEAELKDIRQSN